MENSSEKEAEIPEKRKTLKSISFILGMIFLERFCTVGRNAILMSYLSQKLNYDQKSSFAILGTFEVLSHSFPLFGAVIGDCWWGHFNTIVYMSLVFAVGSLILAVGAIESLGLPAVVFIYVGLTISVIGSGSMRANLTALGGDQINTSEPKEKLSLFFLLQIFSIKLGVFAGRFTNNMLVDQVKCFGADDCYPLVFGIPSITMTLGFVFLLCGKSSLIHKTPSGNAFLSIIKCMMKIISRKFRKHKMVSIEPTKEEEITLSETKRIIKILLLYIPIPIFWSVHQQGTRWVNQSLRMNGDLGFVTIPPNLLIAIYPIMGVVAIPICVFILFPLLAKIKVTSFFQKVTIGGMLAIISSIAAGVIEIQIQQRYVSVAWIVPQYMLATFSENFVYNPHLCFSYNEAPEGLKAIMTSLVFVCRALGYIFMIVVNQSNVFELKSTEFFFLALVLLFALIIFALLPSKYKSTNHHVISSSKDKESEA